MSRGHVSLIVVLICFSLACTQSKQDDLHKKLSATIEDKWNIQGPVVVTLKSVTSFPWDRFYVFGPYTPSERIHSTLGFYWSGTMKVGLGNRDDIDLLIFVRDGKVVQHLEYRRDEAEFDLMTRKEGYSPDEAVFEVRIDDHSGNPALVLYDVNSSNIIGS